MDNEAEIMQYDLDPEPIDPETELLYHDKHPEPTNPETEFLYHPKYPESTEPGKSYKKETYWMQNSVVRSLKQIQDAYQPEDNDQTICRYCKTSIYHDHHRLHDSDGCLATIGEMMGSCLIDPRESTNELEQSAQRNQQARALRALHDASRGVDWQWQRMSRVIWMPWQLRGQQGWKPVMNIEWVKVRQTTEGVEAVSRFSELDKFGSLPPLQAFRP